MGSETSMPKKLQKGKNALYVYSSLITQVDL
jgi:hypothetical protein